MRLKSSLWVKAYIRTCFSRGLHCAVVLKGDVDAGQIYIKCNSLDGAYSLYGPAVSLEPESVMERLFEVKINHVQNEADIDKYLDDQREFDPDIWIIELESRNGEVCLEGQIKL